MQSTCPQCGHHDTIYPRRVNGVLVCRQCAGGEH